MHPQPPSPLWRSCNTASALLACLLLAACSPLQTATGAPGMNPAGSPASLASGVVPAQAPELRPGVLAGYLPRAALPNSLTLLPAPPAAGSAALATDEAVFASTRASMSGPRGALAAADNELGFPKAADRFACALGVSITPERTPHLVTLLRRSFVDAGLSTYAAKDHYVRQRPFAQHATATCVPHEEVKLAKDGSYPSGHAALGWAWALILAEMAPERADAILARGLAYGQSRVVCGVHWQSDVDQGRVMGAAALARLRADPVYQAQFVLARQEVTAARAKAWLPAPTTCAAEAAALDALASQ
jgi:acid phosphatase (class A)